MLRAPCNKRANTNFTVAGEAARAAMTTALGYPIVVPCKFSEELYVGNVSDHVGELCDIVSKISRSVNT